MLTKELYLTFKTKNKYGDLNEDVILGRILTLKKGTVESAISYIINEAVLTHMNLKIDSTIMQMLLLNDYLISLFSENFNVLIHNYIIHYLETHNIITLESKQVDTVKKIAASVHMKTKLETLTGAIDKEWALIF